MALDNAVRGQFVRVLGKDQTFVVLSVQGQRALVAPVDDAWWHGLEREVEAGRFLMRKEGRFVALHPAEIEMRGVGHEVKGAVVAPVLTDEATWRSLEDLAPHEGAWRWSHDNRPR